MIHSAAHQKLIGGSTYRCRVTLPLDGTRDIYLQAQSRRSGRFGVTEVLVTQQ